MDEDSCPELGLIIKNHFKAIDCKMGKSGHHSKHRQSLVTLSRRHSVVQMLENLELDGPNPIRIHAPHPPPVAHPKKNYVSFASFCLTIC
jgi:5'-nucleotidase